MRSRCSLAQGGRLIVFPSLGTHFPLSGAVVGGERRYGGGGAAEKQHPLSIDLRCPSSSFRGGLDPALWLLRSLFTDALTKLCPISTFALAEAIIIVCFK